MLVISTRILVDLTKILDYSFSTKISINSTKHFSPCTVKFITLSYIQLELFLIISIIHLLLLNITLILLKQWN